MPLTESEKRLIQLMGRMSKKEQSKQAPRVRAAYKHALGKQALEDDSQADRQDQERQLGVKRGIKK